MTMDASKKSTPVNSSLIRRCSIELQNITPVDFMTPAPTRYHPATNPPAIKKKNTREFRFVEHDDGRSLPAFPFSIIQDEFDAELKNESLASPPPLFALDDGNVQCHPGEKRSRGDDGKEFTLRVRRRLRHPSDELCSPPAFPKSLSQGQSRAAPLLKPRRTGHYDGRNLHAVAA